MCEEWAGSFKAFSKDVGERPTPAHSLDRIDNNKGYYKGNVRWATSEEQSNNRNNNLRINGESAADISERTGVSIAAIYRRKFKGLPEDRVCAQGDLRLRPLRHGTISGYARGCKCSLCKAANAKKRRDYLNRKKTK